MSADAATIVDADTNITNVEKLTTANGTNHVTLGTKADDSGLATITTGSGDDHIDANAYEGSDITIEINSGAGDDVINGAKSGSMVIYGGSGLDIITGGESSEKFKYRSTTEMGTSLEFAESITSFSDKDDMIWLSWNDINFEDDINISDDGIDTIIQITQDNEKDGYLKLIGIADSSIITFADFQFG